MASKTLANKNGFALLFVFFFVILIAGIVIAYLELTSRGMTDFSFKRADAQAFYAADAAQSRAVQYLQNGWGGIWNTIQPNAGALGTMTITVPPGPPPPPLPAPLESSRAFSRFEFIVDNWNLANSTNPAPFGVTSITSNVASLGGNVPANAVDGNMPSNWRTINNPGPLVQLVIQFPAGSNYSINEIRIRRMGAAAAGRPTNYTWSTSTDGITYTVRFTRLVDPGTNQWYDIFPVVATGVNYVRLDATGWTGNRVQVSEIEIPWIRIRSRCRINNKTGTGFTEKYIRNCFLTNQRAAPATITRIIPSALPNTSIASIWDEISSGIYNTATLF